MITGIDNTDIEGGDFPLVAAGGYVFAAILGDLMQGQVLRGSVSSGTMTKIVDVVDHTIGALEADSSHIYWSEIFNRHVGDQASAIRRADFDGANIETLASTDPPFSLGTFAVDEHALYYLDSGRLIELDFATRQRTILVASTTITGAPPALSYGLNTGQGTLTAQNGNLYWLDLPVLDGTGEVISPVHLLTVCIGSPDATLADALFPPNNCTTELPLVPTIALQCRPPTDNECDGEGPSWEAPGDTPTGGGNGYDDDCDGLVDEGCACTNTTVMKDCWLVPSSLTTGAPDYQVVGWCYANAVGVLYCKDDPKNPGTLVWDSQCVGAMKPAAADGCVAGDLDCNGIELDAPGGCDCGRAARAELALGTGGTCGLRASLF